MEAGFTDFFFLFTNLQILKCILFLQVNPRLMIMRWKLPLVKKSSGAALSPTKLRSMKLILASKEHNLSFTPFFFLEDVAASKSRGSGSLYRASRRPFQLPQKSRYLQIDVKRTIREKQICEFSIWQNIWDTMWKWRNFERNSVKSIFQL